MIHYRLKEQHETIGQIPLQIACLANLDETIDALFEHLKKEGRESDLEDLCPYFGVVWPSARALAEYLSHQPLKGATLLEIGCGLAIPSLLACRAGAQVTATDFHPEVPRFLKINRANNGAESLTYLHLDWKHSALPEGRFDWVIGSDILYEKHQPELVAEVMSTHLRPGGRAVLADPGRPYLQAFVDEMTARGFRSELQARQVHDLPVPKDIYLLEFTRP